MHAALPEGIGLINLNEIRQEMKSVFQEVVLRTFKELRDFQS